MSPQCSSTSPVLCRSEMKRASLRFGDASPSPQPSSVASWYTPGLSDGLGDRLLMFDNTTACSLELLRFKPQFGEGPGFAAALRRRVDELSGFEHPSIAKVRKVEWLRNGEGLALVSNQTAGRRLSEVMDKAVGPSFALELVRQLTPVLASLEQQVQDGAHGTLTPDRIVVTPEGRLVLTEHVIGPAVEALRLQPSQLRSQLGIVVPGADGDRPVRLDGRTDVLQLAFMALAMLLGRRLRPTEYPERGIGLLDELVQSSAYNSSAAPRLRDWLERALQLGGRAFSSAQDAHAALHELPEESELLMAAPTRKVHAFHPPSEALKAFLTRIPGPRIPCRGTAGRRADQPAGDSGTQATEGLPRARTRVRPRSGPRPLPKAGAVGSCLHLAPSRWARPLSSWVWCFLCWDACRALRLARRRPATLQPPASRQRQSFPPPVRVWRHLRPASQHQRRGFPTLPARANRWGGWRLPPMHLARGSPLTAPHADRHPSCSTSPRGRTP